MSSAYSKRTRDKTSPTGSTPYSDLKKSRESVVEEKDQTEGIQVQRRFAGKALFREWTKGEEKLLVMYVSVVYSLNVLSNTR